MVIGGRDRPGRRVCHVHQLHRLRRFRCHRTGLRRHGDLGRAQSGRQRQLVLWVHRPWRPRERGPSARPIAEQRRADADDGARRREPGNRRRGRRGLRGPACKREGPARSEPPTGPSLRYRSVREALASTPIARIVPDRPGRSGRRIRRARDIPGPRVFPSRSWLRGTDLNCRPLGYEPSELPDCSTPRVDATSAACAWATETYGEGEGDAPGEGVPPWVPARVFACWMSAWAALISC